MRQTIFLLPISFKIIYRSMKIKLHLSKRCTTITIDRCTTTDWPPSRWRRVKSIQYYYMGQRHHEINAPSSKPNYTLLWPQLIEGKIAVKLIRVRVHCIFAQLTNSNVLGKLLIRDSNNTVNLKLLYSLVSYDVINLTGG
jgi:hypothetical protein